MEERNHYLNSLLDAIPIPIVEKKTDLTYSHANTAFCHALGIEKKDILGKKIDDFWPEETVSELQRTDREILKTGKVQHYEQRMRFADNLFHSIEITKAGIMDSDGNLISIVAAIHDVTERKIYEAKIRHIAMHDPLTNLPNRRMLKEYLNHLLPIAKKQGNSLALLFIDLDNFKPINDRYGHGVGDVVLKTVADRLSSVLWESDYPCRLGGDEFAVLLGSFNDLSDIETVASKILRAIKKTVAVKELECCVEASIGVALFPDDADNLDELIRKSDRAMYVAKEAGKGHVVFYGKINGHEAG